MNVSIKLISLGLAASIALVSCGDIAWQADGSTLKKKVTGVRLKDSVGLAVGNSMTLAASIVPADAYDRAVSWYSSDDSVAGVSPAGLVTGLAPGTATVTATTAEGGYSATCAVKVVTPLIPQTLVAGGNYYNFTVSSFSVGIYEVTQAQYAQVTGSLPPYCASDHGLGDAFPVYGLNWYEAIAFCNRLSIREGYAPVYAIGGITDPDGWGTVPMSVDAAWDAVAMDLGKGGYRLPTDVEWRFAAGGGNASRGYTYSGSNTIDDVAWYRANADFRAHTVGGKAANELGLYDMTGNVYEWCWNWNGEDADIVFTDYAGPASGSGRIFHGGDCCSFKDSCIVNSITNCSPDRRIGYYGFRVVRSIR